MLRTRRELFFRSSPEPTLTLPVNVRSAGHYSLTSDWLGEKPRAKWFLQMFWTIEGEGRFSLGRRHLLAGAGEIFVYWPGETHLVTPVQKPWRYRWLTLDGDRPERLFPQFGERSRSWRGGSCPEPVFEQLHLALRDPTPAGERKAGCLAYEIITQACAKSEERPRTLQPADEYRAILDGRFSDPHLTVDRIADECRVHRATLFRRFRDAFGISPSVYLGNLRLQHALQALQSTSDPIQQVALDAGFDDPNYFSRVVRKVTGRSPSTFRRHGA